MYSELQSAIQAYLVADSYFGAGSVILEDQPKTPDEFQRRVSGVGWGLLIGKPIVRKEGLFQTVLFPICADENREINRKSGGPNKQPDEVILTAENILRNYQPSEIWTPIKLSADVKQLFPDDGKTPWALVVSTKTIPVSFAQGIHEAGDLIVFEDDSEMIFHGGIGAAA